MKYSDMLKANKEFLQRLSGEIYNVAILSNIIISPLKEVLEYTLRINNINAQVWIGEYDNIVQDSALFKDSKLVIIIWELGNIIDGLQYKANLMSDNELKALITKIKSEIDYVLSKLNKTPIILFNKFSTIVFNYQNLRQNKFDAICQELNSYIDQKMPNNCIMIDIDKIIALNSIAKSTDMRYYYSSKALYTIEFFKEYSNFIKPIILAANGKAKKALIFDCDNSLWKGIIGEDGFDGIEMSSKSSKGVVYEEVQSIAMELNKSGIILGLCSKNNDQDVEEVIKYHPDMVLKNENIIIKKVNWADKKTNLVEIAEELNIGIDSLVFIDDSPFEVNYIKENLPEVSVLQVPDKLYEYPKLIREISSLFFNMSVSQEDLNRIQMYNEQKEREILREEIHNLEDYLKSLDIELDIYIDDEKHLQRIAQMTQKTNQFNLTTRRYTDIDIQTFIEGNNYRTFSFEARDKYGTYGITGLVIVNINSSGLANIDTLLMSCRVIGRNIEFAFFDFIVKYLKDMNIKKLTANYIKTVKNNQVKDFYEKIGFIPISVTVDNKCYELNLINYIFNKLDYIKINYD